MLLFLTLESPLPHLNIVLLKNFIYNHKKAQELQPKMHVLTLFKKITWNWQKKNKMEAKQRNKIQEKYNWKIN